MDTPKPHLLRTKCLQGLSGCSALPLQACQQAFEVVLVVDGAQHQTLQRHPLLAVDADDLALRAVMHDGGSPLREARPERVGVQVLEEAPQRVVRRHAVVKVDVLPEKVAPVPGEVGDFR